jgi:hypothetical protein
MNDGQDERLGELLRHDAPPPRDAMFRLAVLERREQKRFQQRSLTLAAAAAVVAVIFAAGFALRVDLLPTALVALLIAALAGACVLSARGVREVLHRLRARKSTAGN